MKIGVIGETRLPVLPYGGGGLGRATHDIATELQIYHDVTLCAIHGSEFEGEIRQSLDIADYDVILDYSHNHALSQRNGYAPILNLIGDRECQYCPPNAIVESEYMQGHYPSAKIVLSGIRVNDIPFSEQHDGYLVFIGTQAHKQPEVAKQVAREAGRELVMIENVSESVKWEIIKNALGMLCPYTIDASPRTPLEAAACGVPTICLDGDGTKAHVVEGKTGYICHTPADMVEKVGMLEKINRYDCREWVEQNHDISRTIVELMELLEAVKDGKRW